MKQLLLLSFFAFLYAGGAAAQTPPPNIFIITIDGFRWQEVFAGADSLLISDSRFTKDTGLAKMLYWDETPEARRRKLLPFFWNVIAAKGQLHGNRSQGSRVDVANVYKISYAGYNELLTGTTDLRLFSNRKKHNRNINILEKLGSHPAYRGSIAAFSSWDVFPYILNEPRSHIPLSSGYDSSSLRLEESSVQQLTSAVQQHGIHTRQATRHDLLTFVTAVDYIQHRQPRIVYLSFGETDEFAHSGRYDQYLQTASRFDRMLQELWYMVQTTPGYADNTSFIITTDHGRGKKSAAWQRHGPLTPGSGEVWRAYLGPGFAPLGEVTEPGQVYQKELPALVEQLAGACTTAAGLFSAKVSTK